MEMWGIDPGAIDLFHAVNQNGEHVSCNTKQYRELSKQTASTKTGNAWWKRSAWTTHGTAWYCSSHAPHSG